jgi:hypothetical protein
VNAAHDRSVVVIARATHCSHLNSETAGGCCGLDTAAGFTKPALLKKNIPPGNRAASTSSRPETPSNFQHKIASRLQARNAFSSILPLAKSSDLRSQRIVSAESITCALCSTPTLYTVDRRESALVPIRTWLCSASRVQPPHWRVSGTPASRAFYANPNHPGWRLARGVVSHAAVAGGCLRSPVPALPDSRIKFKLGHLHTGTRITGPPCRPGDASCQKGAPDASQNLDKRTQPIEKEELNRS